MTDTPTTAPATDSPPPAAPEQWVQDIAPTRYFQQEAPLGRPLADGSWEITYTLAADPAACRAEFGATNLAGLARTGNAAHDAFSARVEAAVRHNLEEWQALWPVRPREAAPGEAADLRFLCGDIPKETSIAAYTGDQDKANPFIVLGRHLAAEDDAALRYYTGHEMKHAARLGHPDSRNGLEKSETIAAKTGDSPRYTQRITTQSYRGDDIRPSHIREVSVGDDRAMAFSYGRWMPHMQSPHILPERLLHAAQSVLYAPSPMTIDLRPAAQSGLHTGGVPLRVDLSLPPGSTEPVVEGVLLGKTGAAMPLDIQRAHDASIQTVTARGAPVGLDATGCYGACIEGGDQPNTIALSGGRNTARGGQAQDRFVLTRASGYGNVIHGMDPGEKGDWIVLAKDDFTRSEVRAPVAQPGQPLPPAGSELLLFGTEAWPPVSAVLVPGVAPQDLAARIRTEHLQRPEPVPLRARLHKEPFGKDSQKWEFDCTYDVAVTAGQAAGFAVSNKQGGLVVKMTQAEYASRTVAAPPPEDKSAYYTLRFTSEGGTQKEIRLKANTTLAVMGPYGYAERLVGLEQSRREAGLASALAKAGAPPSAIPAATPAAASADEIPSVPTGLPPAPALPRGRGRR